MKQELADPQTRALRILKAVCPPHLFEEIEGDLIQRFHRDVRAVGLQRAKRRLAWAALRFIRPGVLFRNKLSFSITPAFMVAHYFKTAVRFFQNHKMYFGINLTGLTIGMCVCFFALLYVRFELRYDRYHEHADRIYRLVTQIETPSGVDYRSTPAPLAPALQQAFPEVKGATRIALDYLLVQKEKFGDHAEERLAYADSTLFSVFSFPLVIGRPGSVLQTPYNVVISETYARKQFGKDDPIGKTLVLDGKYTATITGIMKDIPHNSHFRVDILVSLSTLTREWNPGLEHNWNRLLFHSYILLDDRNHPDALAAKLPPLVQNHVDASRGKHTVLLEPLRSVYFSNAAKDQRAGSLSQGNVSNVYMVGIVAVAVLFIAGFNFINLTTAFSLQRAKEVGVRKVMGAAKTQLIFQFLTDAIALSFLAFLFAVMLTALFLPVFNELAGKTILNSVFHDPDPVLILFSIACGIGVLSGIYPAFFLSAFQPVATLKGRRKRGSAGLRKVLVIAQFSIAAVLIVFTLVVYTQLDFMRNHDPGFKKERRIVIDFHFNNGVRNASETLREQVTRIPGITRMSLSSSIPGRANHKLNTEIENTENEWQSFLSDAYFTDYDFLDQYEISLVAGRGFSDEIAGDVDEAMLINETGAKKLGYQNPEEILGKAFKQYGNTGTIVGVVKDFHFHSLQETVQPLTFQIGDILTFITLDISTPDVAGTLAALDQTWRKSISDMPMSYFFADEAYNEQYNAEERFGKLFLCFAAFAVFIACLGLVGLSAFFIQQRTKEIGIRKVLGSSTAGIVKILAGDLFMLITIAIVIAVPIAWITIDHWLAGYAYKVSMPWWAFGLTGAVVLLMAFITIGYQVITTALADPVKSLRSE